MSLKVEVVDLPAKAAEYGPGFLISGDGSGGPHTMHVRFEFSEGDDVVATCAVGRSAARNVEVNPLVTLLWPPREDGGYSLIADGQAQADEGTATITILSAVLHRHA